MRYEAIDLCGQRFGRLVVVARAENGRNWQVRWNCVCNCGAEVVKPSAYLRHGTSRSCGCLRREVTRSRARTHGDSKHWIYKRFMEMHKRVLHAPEYAHVTICAEWDRLTGYEAFKAWAHTSGASQDLTLDRIDPHGPYSPDNCRWATWKVQQNNKRSTLRLSDGRPARLVARENGISDGLFTTRVYVLKWPLDKAASEPIRRRGHQAG